MARKKTILTPAQDKLNAIGIEVICERIANCETFREITKDVGVGLGVFSGWLIKHSEQYARAMELRADKMADDILQIADDGLNDSYTDENGVVRVNQDVIARSRLRVDARKWLASKMAPKRYGDKLDITANVTTHEQAIDDLE
jgi:hypothetical protein